MLTPAERALARLRRTEGLTVDIVTSRFIRIYDGGCAWFARAAEVKTPKLVAGDGGHSYTAWCGTHKSYKLADLPPSAQRAAKAAGLNAWGF